MRIPRIPLPARNFQTFGAVRPLATHWRKATCAEADCEPYRDGWWTIVPADSPQLKIVFEAINGADGFRRNGVEKPSEDPGMRSFWFEPGTPCFKASEHKVPLERPEVFYRRDGDLVRNAGGLYRFDRHDQWQEEWNDRTDRLRQL